MALVAAIRAARIQSCSFMAKTLNERMDRTVRVYCACVQTQ